MATVLNNKGTAFRPIDIGDISPGGVEPVRWEGQYFLLSSKANPDVLFWISYEDYEEEAKRLKKELRKKRDNLRKIQKKIGVVRPRFSVR